MFRLYDAIVLFERQIDELLTNKNASVSHGKSNRICGFNSKYRSSYKKTKFLNKNTKNYQFHRERRLTISTKTTIYKIQVERYSGFCTTLHSNEFNGRWKNTTWKAKRKTFNSLELHAINEKSLKIK